MQEFLVRQFRLGDRKLARETGNHNLGRGRITA
jgi:hypothetical protein